jgi:hypothetical protein
MKYLNDIIRVSNYSISACQRDKSKLRDLLNVYLKVFGENLKTSCGNCIGDGIIRLQIELRKYNLTNKLKQEIMAEEKRKYVMKPGSVIDMAFSTGEYHTPDNITDKKARQLIARNPAYLKWFVKYPKDEVDKILAKTDPEKIEAAKKAEEERKAAEEKQKESTGKVTPEKDKTTGNGEEKKVASPASIEALVKDNSKDALLEKAKDIPGVNPEMDKAVIAKMILEA